MQVFEYLVGYQSMRKLDFFRRYIIRNIKEKKTKILRSNVTIDLHYANILDGLTTFWDVRVHVSLSMLWKKGIESHIL